MFRAAANRIILWAESREPDRIIGTPSNAVPLLMRWYIGPENWACRAFVHRLMRSDDDRALHDHPWPHVSIILRGAYVEHTIAAGGIHRRVNRPEGSVIFGRARAAHRLELPHGPVWTLFIRGPKLREWGFHCANGWRPWRSFDREGCE